MLGKQTADKGLVCLKEVSGGMFVAGGFRSIECIFDHSPPKQGRGQRVPSIDQPRRRI
jgi:hypothetical protein